MPIIGILIALLVLGGTTVVASDAAAPGDLLFPIDRAVEETRLALARGESETELRVRFAEERVEEVGEIIAEEGGGEDGSAGAGEVPVSDEALNSIDQGLTLALDLIGGLPETAGLEGVLAGILENVRRLPPDALSRLEIEADDEETNIKIRSGGVELEYEVDEDGDIKFKLKGDNRGTGAPGAGVPEIEIEIEGEDDGDDEDIDEEDGDDIDEDIEDENEDDANEEDEAGDADEGADDEDDADEENENEDETGGNGTGDDGGGASGGNSGSSGN